MTPAARRPRSGWVPIVAALLAVTALGACGRSEAPARPLAAEGGPAYGDTLVEASIGDISGLIPNITSDSASHEIGDLIYSNLVRTDKTLAPEGELAERWEISKDEMTITFYLRHGAKWHDGEEVTAEDVDFTYRYMIDPKTPTAYAEPFRQVLRAEVVDRYTFRVTYDKPYAPALLSWGIWILPRHILEPAWKAGVDLRTTRQNRFPIGSGPYRFGEWKTGEKIVLEANPDYFEGRPYLQRVVYRIIPDQSTIFLELKAQNIDMAGLTPIQYRRQTEYPAFQKAFHRYRYLVQRLRLPGVQPAGRALSGQARPAGHRPCHQQARAHRGGLAGPGPPGGRSLQAGDVVVQRRREDLPLRSRAGQGPPGRSRLEAEQPTGSWRKDGKPFSFTIRTNQGNAVRQQTAEIIQRRLGAIGIDVKIHVVEWAAFHEHVHSQEGLRGASSWGGGWGWTRISTRSGIPARPAPRT